MSKIVTVSHSDFPNTAKLTRLARRREQFHREVCSDAMVAHPAALLLPYSAKDRAFHPLTDAPPPVFVRGALPMLEKRPLRAAHAGAVLGPEGFRRRSLSAPISARTQRRA